MLRPIPSPRDRAVRSPRDRKRAHDNPHWPVMSREDAEAALFLHLLCEPLECSTLVAGRKGARR